MRHIREIVEKLVKDTKITDTGEENILFEKWAEIIGKNTAKTCTPFKISGKKLFIYAENSVIMGEIVYRKKEMMDRINGFYKKQKINEIIFRIKQ